MGLGHPDLTLAHIPPPEARLEYLKDFVVILVSNDCCWVASLCLLSSLATLTHYSLSCTRHRSSRGAPASESWTRKGSSLLQLLSNTVDLDSLSSNDVDLRG